MNHNYVNYTNYLNNQGDDHSLGDTDFKDLDLIQFTGNQYQSNFHNLSLNPPNLASFNSNVSSSFYRGEQNPSLLQLQQINVQNPCLLRFQQSYAQNREVIYDHNSRMSMYLLPDEAVTIHNARHPDPISDKSRRIIKREKAKQCRKVKVPKITEDDLASGKIPQKFIPEGFGKANVDEKTRKKMMQMIRNRVSAQTSRERKKEQFDKLEMERNVVSEENRLLKMEIERLRNDNKVLTKENTIQKGLLASLGQNYDQSLQNNNILQNGFFDSTDNATLNASDSPVTSGFDSPVIRRSFKPGGFMKYSLAFVAMLAVIMTPKLIIHHDIKRPTKFNDKVNYPVPQEIHIQTHSQGHISTKDTKLEENILPDDDPTDINPTEIIADEEFSFDEEVPLDGGDTVDEEVMPAEEVVADAEALPNEEVITPEEEIPIEEAIFFEEQIPIEEVIFFEEEVSEMPMPPPPQVITETEPGITIDGGEVSSSIREVRVPDPEPERIIVPEEFRHTKKNRTVKEIIPTEELRIITKEIMPTSELISKEKIADNELTYFNDQATDIYPLTNKLSILRRIFDQNYMSKFFSRLEVVNLINFRGYVYPSKVVIIQQSINYKRVLEIDFPAYLKASEKLILKLPRSKEINHEQLVFPLNTNDSRYPFINQKSFSSMCCSSGFEFLGMKENCSQKGYNSSNRYEKLIKFIV